MSSGAAPRPLRRQTLGRGPAAPVRMVHLGLGSFFRSHQAWFTARAPDAEAWGIAAFCGRSMALAHTLTSQEGLYTLVLRGDQDDRFEAIASLAAAHPADDHEAWSAAVSSPDTELITLTVTEAGYRCAPSGALDLDAPDLQADLAALRADAGGAVHSAPGRLLAGLLARHRRGAGPVTVVSCDNLVGNGELLRGAVLQLADAVSPSARGAADEQLHAVSSVVDRITPRTTARDLATVEAACGYRDLAPVVAEPDAEWVLEDIVADARPAWEGAGAVFTDDLGPFEQRKLWLLNGGHSLLAYLGALRGATTVADALRDDVCRHWLERWWELAGPLVPQPAAPVREYVATLRERFGNRRIAHRLAQIAHDGSQKLPVRLLPVLRSERAAGRLPEVAVVVLGAWLAHLRGAGAPVVDVRGAELVDAAAGRLEVSVPRALTLLDAELGADRDLVGALVELTASIEATGAPA